MSGGECIIHPPTYLLIGCGLLLGVSTLPHAWVLIARMSQQRNANAWLECETFTTVGDRPWRLQAGLRDPWDLLDDVVRDTALELGPEWRSQGPLKPEWFYGSHSSTFLCGTWFSKRESLAAKVLQVQIASQGVSLPSSIPLWFLFARSH